MPKVSRQRKETQRIFCNTCKWETNHTLLAKHEVDYVDWIDGQHPFRESFEYKFWICAGCEEGTLETRSSNDGMTDEEGQPYWSSSYAPNRTEKSVTEKRFRKLPEKLDQIYREAIRAFNNGLSILCASGLRALIEGICADKNIKGSNLKIKIDAMTEIFPKNIVANLHGFRFMGNTALHELEAPSHANLRLAIEICEDLLNFVYDLEYKAQRLTASQKKSKKEKS